MAMNFAHHHLYFATFSNERDSYDKSKPK